MSLGFSWAISLIRGRRDLSNIIIDNHTQRATTRECKPMSHHERTIPHRTRRAQGHSCHCINKINFTRRGDLSQHLWCEQCSSGKSLTQACKTAKAEHGIKIASLTATQSPRPWASVFRCVAIGDNNRSLRCSLPLNQSYLVSFVLFFP